MAFKVPSVSIKRDNFLRKELKNKYPEEVIEKAVDQTPMIACIKQKDIDKMVKLFVGMLQSGWVVSGIVDIGVIGYLVNYLLEETNVSQAQEIQSVLENLLKDDSLERSKAGLLKGWNDDFTGKVLLGEE